jgi:hypothetical protein
MDGKLKGEKFCLDCMTELIPVQIHVPGDVPELWRRAWVCLCPPETASVDVPAKEIDGYRRMPSRAYGAGR